MADRKGVVLSTVSGAWALMGLGVVATTPVVDWRSTIGLLMITQAFTGMVAWRRFRMTAGAVLPDFLTMLLLMQFITKVFTAAGIVVRSNPALFGSVGERLAWRDGVPMEYQFQAEAVFLLATVVFAGTWRLLEGRYPRAVWREPHQGAMWATYLLALSLYMLLTAASTEASFATTRELAKLFAIGALAMLLGGRSRFAMGRAWSWVPIMALGPLYLIALRSGMKGEVITASLPFLIPIFRRPSAGRFAVLSGFAIVVILFIFPFSQTWREANWSSEGQALGVKEVGVRVYDQWQRSGIVETTATSTSQWLARGSSAEQGGLVMMLADQDGLLGSVLLEGLATIFVPRFLWADKPIYQPGAWFTWYIGQARSPESATSSTAMMLPTELYWMFGMSGVLVGMCLLSLLYYGVWVRLSRMATRGLIPSLGLFAMLARSGGGLEEIHTIYAISSPIILLAYVAMFDYGYRAMTTLLKGKHVGRLASTSQ